MDKNNAVGSLGAIEGHSVFDDLNTLDIIDIEVRKHIIEVTVVKHVSTILHIQLYAINKYQWLGIRLQRVDTVDKHHVSHAGDTAMSHRTHICAQLLLYQRVNTCDRGISEIRSVGTQSSGSR